MVDVSSPGNCSALLQARNHGLLFIHGWYSGKPFLCPEEFGNQAVDCLVIQEVSFGEQNIRWKMNPLFLLTQLDIGAIVKAFTSGYVVAPLMFDIICEMASLIY